HQRRFSGAVLTDQRVDLAGLHGEIDVAQRLHARKALADAAHLQHCRHRIMSHSAGRSRRTALLSQLALRWQTASRPHGSRRRWRASSPWGFGISPRMMTSSRGARRRRASRRMRRTKTARKGFPSYAIALPQTGPAAAARRRTDFSSIELRALVIT